MTREIGESKKMKNKVKRENYSKLTIEKQKINVILTKSRKRKKKIIRRVKKKERNLSLTLDLNKTK